jgi:hypothetical protein
MTIGAIEKKDRLTEEEVYRASQELCVIYPNSVIIE